jgi:uncharacterized protein YqjF (DUF2071 family)
VTGQHAIAATPAARVTPRWCWTQDWRDVFFAHWQVPAGPLASQLTGRIAVDTWRDQAWVSAVAFRLNTRPVGWPSVPFCSNLLELNLRTYVRDRGEPAVWFLSMHGSRRLAVWLGQRLTPLPYSFAPIHRHQVGERQSFTCGDKRRIQFVAEFRPVGEPCVAMDGTLDAWLLERYRAIVPASDNRICRMTVEHPPWRIQPAAARVTAGVLGQPWGLDLHRPPDWVNFSSGVSARVGAFEIVQ